MDNSLLTSIIDVVFKHNMIYLAPVLLLMMATLFVDRLVDLVYNALDNKRNY